MKSTRVFKILSIALAAAVVFYFLVQGVRYLTNPYATTRVYTSTTEDAVEASGWLVREEETFRTDAETLSPTREEGEKVGQGQVIAATYDSPGPWRPWPRFRPSGFSWSSWSMPCPPT